MALARTTPVVNVLTVPMPTRPFARVVRDSGAPIAVTVAVGVVVAVLVWLVVVMVPGELVGLAGGGGERAGRRGGSRRTSRAGRGGGARQRARRGGRAGRGVVVARGAGRTGRRGRRDDRRWSQRPAVLVPVVVVAAVLVCAAGGVTGVAGVWVGAVEPVAVVRSAAVEDLWQRQLPRRGPSFAGPSWWKQSQCRSRHAPQRNRPTIRLTHRSQARLRRARRGGVDARQERGSESRGPSASNCRRNV